MYESGGEIHWTGHLIILFCLMFVGAVASLAHWHENLMGLPFLLYFGYLIFRAGRRVVRFLQGLFQRLS
ncbi:hypothetical protein MJ904_07315 [Massilia sp. MB5]|uniref:hypothetical protein n=1 Tax=Massilia sp. MB5 TaxID=2919578 RepID=UPI001F117A22|nr:hypothetical protein [Massilia sp. MB5]UMR31978.1 hypothetical protein MJ904_07315 [Massilia sp. MB5]